MTPSLQLLHWRLDVYDKICRACTQNNLAPLRFLTFRPERMRIRIGESQLRSQVPVIFAPHLGDQMAALLPPAASVPSLGGRVMDRDTLRRAIGLAQLDGDIDIMDVATWEGAPAFIGAMASMEARFLDEARASGAGEETAALFQLIAMSSLRNVLLHRMGPSERFLGMAALLAHLMDKALDATVARSGDGLSARLGLLLAAASSPLALMGSAPSVAARPANAYRTVPSAYLRARDMVREFMDAPGLMNVGALRARLAAELLGQPDRKRDIVRSIVAEAVRDLAMLSTLTQGSELRDIAGRSSALAEALFQPLGAERLRARIERHPRGREEPLGRLLVLLDNVGAIMAGDLSPLARIGSVEERADLAAVGALALAFDELALEQGGKALAMVRPVPEQDAERAREDGRAYRFSLDDEPLFLMPRRREEAFLFADMKDFTKRTQAIQEENMGDFLKQHFYEPILRACAVFSRNARAHVAVVNLLGDAVACRGDIRSMVALALSVRQLLEDAAQELETARTSHRTKDDEALREIDFELSRVAHELQAPSLPADERVQLKEHQQELIAGRTERLQRAVGSGLEAGVFVTWGREATVIHVGGPEVGAWSVTIAEQLNAAARGTSRSGELLEDRVARRRAREAVVGRSLIEPYMVHTASDPDDTAVSTSFYNAGSALTGEALAAYRAASPDMMFHDLTVAREALSPRLQKYWLERSVESFVICSDARGAPALLFRLAGRTLFRGMEATGGAEIWEILLVDRGFGRDLLASITVPPVGR